MIKSKLSGLFLDIEFQGGSGSKVVPWDRNGDANQVWYDDPATGTIRSKLNNCALTVENDQLIIKDVQPGNAAQAWSRQGDVIKNTKTGKVLDVFGENTAKGAQIGAYDNNGGANQKWEFEVVAGAPPVASTSPYWQGQKKEFHIESVMNGKVLDITQAQMEPGAKIVMWERHQPPEKNQLWYLDGQGFIRSSLNDLAISNAGMGKPIVTAPFTNVPRCQYVFQGNKVMNKAGEYLDIAEEKTNDGAEVVSYELNDRDNQHWRQRFI